jgi:hypothetical protein
MYIKNAQDLVDEEYKNRIVTTFLAPKDKFKPVP